MLAQRTCCLLVYVLYIITSATVIHASSTDSTTDLYKLLGVTRKATIQEIKSAYRRKARDTHPDKNQSVPAQQAAEQFRQVVHAFEILSDATSRRRYDQTGKQDPSSSNNNNNSGNSWSNWQWSGQRGGGSAHFYWNVRPALKDRFDVQEAMSRVLHVVSLEQLKLIMLDHDDLLERNILICAYTPPLEKLVDEDLVFPYPFAAMSAQGIWWEDLLQTVKIRYHKSNELSKFFQLPTGDDLSKSGAPIFLYGKKGEPLDRMKQLQTANRATFESWAWEQMQVTVTFVNRHDHTVELYWIHGTRATTRADLPAGHEIELTSMLTHEWYIRDKRVDARPDSPGNYRLTTESSLLTLKIGVEGGPKIRDDWTTTVIIPKRTCFDLSGHCLFWSSHNECERNPNFMFEQCRLTCKLCESDERTEFDDEHDDQAGEQNIADDDNNETRNNDEL
ncbi:hypothetical protein MPSEU_000304800 [Mayamaea pseudoterrestris]|nr:hypothetical protein MPSEU_000304800 [Mayamaea pseudoterrestris]